MSDEADGPQPHALDRRLFVWPAPAEPSDHSTGCGTANPLEDPVIVEIQCLPFPPGTDQNPYAHIEAAIALVQASGLKYEVDALGTTIEGEPDAVWALVRKMHEACLDAGANALVSVVKFEESRAATPPTIGSLTGKFREGSQ